MRIKRWHGLIVWAAGTLLAIAVIGEGLYAGAAIALVSGAAFGLVNWYAGRNARVGRDDDAV